MLCSACNRKSEVFDEKEKNEEIVEYFAILKMFVESSESENQKNVMING